MVQFWLDDFTEILNMNNFTIEGTQSDKKIKLFNAISIITIITGLFLTIKYKKSKFFGYTILVLSVIILLKSISISSFSEVKNFGDTPEYSNTINADTVYSNNIVLLKDVPENINKLYIGSYLNLNINDIIKISDSKSGLSEVHVISNIFDTPDENIIILLDNTRNKYSKDTTSIFKLSGSTPDIITAPDGNKSIQDSEIDPRITNGSILSSNGQVLSSNLVQNDWNLELGTYMDSSSTYRYQGPPDGPLRCRESTLDNPMGTINVTEYSEQPTMYGTCNVGGTSSTKDSDGNNLSNDNLMTENFENGLSMRVDDLLFHKGNSQSRFSPNPVDTLPDNQAAFAHFCYRSPTNLVNPKYASIFVNDPEKFKLVSQLAQATGTENGG